MPEHITTPEARFREATALDRLSDRALFSRAGADEAAFGELVRRYREPLRRHAARYVGDADAEDVVQQAMVNANLALRRDPDRDIEPRPWLYTVTTNAAIDHRRARAARPLGDRIHEEPDYETLGAPDSDDPHQVVAEREAVRSVVSRIQSLAPNQRRAATARFLEGRSHDEIAGELGVSKGAARELIHRARRNLREAIPALSPVPLIEKLRHGIGAVFAGSSPPAAKLAAGAALVAVAAGGGAAVVASPDGGGDERTRAEAAAATPAGAVSGSRQAAAGRSEDDSGAGAGDGGGDAPNRNRSKAPAGSGQGSDAGEASALGSPAVTPASAAGSGSAPIGDSDPVQSTVDQLGIGEIAEEIPDPGVDVPSEISDVTDELPVEPPSLPAVDDPLGGGN